MRNQLELDLLTLAESAAERLGYELVDLEFLHQGADWVLRVFIDALGGVDLRDCEKVSQVLEGLLDSAELIHHHYVLEVSSPGIERRLRTAAHFQRYLSQIVAIRLFEKVDGRRNIQGTLLEAGPEGVVVSVAPTEQVRVPLDEIRRAHLVVDFKEVLKSKFSKEEGTSGVFPTHRPRREPGRKKK